MSLLPSSSLFRGVGWRELTDFVSPAVFDVVQPKSVAAAASALFRAQMDSAGTERAQAERARHLQEHRLPVVVGGPVDGRVPTVEADRRTRGETLLRLYFHQLLVGPVALLDLGPSRFSGVAPVRWAPTAARHTWTPAFRSAVRDLYGGFYGGDDRSFDRTLEVLGLRPARSIFLAHFGGDQTAVRFESAHFRTTFHAAFVACRDARVQIHPDFLPMGLMLASLYAHLEQLEVPLDVRAAWGEVSTSKQVAG
ncbi:MAG: hypothetical protein FJ090_23210 [Deltaproteobacteria bacterium]|nr:hypothetical protein [Deltaproteobacteria bacterium]